MPVWKAMNLKALLTKPGLVSLLELGAVSDEGRKSETAAKAVALLLRSDEIKMATFDDALSELSREEKLKELTLRSETCSHIFAWAFIHVLPKSDDAPWGWERPSCNWSSWWPLVMRRISAKNCMPNSLRFDVLVLTLNLLQEKSGVPMKDWVDLKQGGRLKECKARLEELAVQADVKDLIATLRDCGVDL